MYRLSGIPDKIVHFISKQTGREPTLSNKNCFSSCKKAPQARPELYPVPTGLFRLLVGQVSQVLIAHRNRPLVFYFFIFYPYPINPVHPVKKQVLIFIF